MSDPAEQQAAYAEFLIELALQHLHPEPMPPQPAPAVDMAQAMKQMGEAMNVLYPSRRA
jgi:hypothetical protein